MQTTILAWVDQLNTSVKTLKSQVRQFVYELSLSGRLCPQCCGGLEMIRDGLCHCQGCGNRFDPTMVFQACSHCGGALKLVQTRYHCSGCGTFANSHFRFDPVRIDASYFRKAMAEHRHRRRKRQRLLVEQLRNALSASAELPVADLTEHPDLLDDLNALVGHDVDPSVQWEASTDVFDLVRYEQHVMATVKRGSIDFDDVPPLEDNPADRIRRFVAVVFLDHRGQLTVEQDGPFIELHPHETHRERRGVPQPA